MSPSLSKIDQKVNEELSAVMTRLATKGVKDTGVKLDQLSLNDCRRLGIQAFRDGNMYEVIMFMSAIKALEEQPKAKHEAKA
jgi:hypothetical protein